MPRTWKRKTNKGSWTEESLREALNFIKNGNSISAASRVFKIPFSTLQERRTKNLVTKPVLGCSSTFTPEQESALTERIKKISDMFYGITAQQVRRVAYDFAEKNKVPHKFSHSERMAGRDWFNGFLRRNPTISIRKPEATSVNRITGFNREDVKKFYDNLEQVLAKNNITPDRIYNADETGITTVTEPGNIVATKGKRRVGSVTSWERGKLVTVMCSISAAGSYIPPMFIYPRQRMSPLLTKGGPPCAIYQCSPKGWTNEALFATWLKHFIYYCKASLENLVLLILDNHNSHTTLESYELCRANGVIMLSLPPHCSHRMQPLDVSFYATLKAAYKRECDMFIKTNRFLRITPYELATLFNQAYSRVATMAVAVSGFKATGIHPLNPSIFTDADFIAADEFLNRSNVSLPVLENDEQEQQCLSATSSGNLQIQASEPNEIKEKNITPVSSTNQTLSQPEDHNYGVTFEELIPIPGPSMTRGKSKQREKMSSEILTSTPKKAELELAIEKKKSKELKKENSMLKKQAKDLLKKLGLSGFVGSNEEDRPKIKKPVNNLKVEKARKTSNIGRVQKKKVYSSSDSEDELDTEMRNLCDDDELDDLPQTEDANLCFVCGEFGRDGEEWYRCTSCGIWLHALCSAADSPENFLCDRCIKQ